MEYDDYGDDDEWGGDDGMASGSFNMSYDTQTHEEGDTGFSFNFNKRSGATEADVVRALKGLVAVGMDPEKLIKEIVAQFVELEEKK